MKKEILIPELINRIGFLSDIHGVYGNLLKTLELRPDIKYWFCAGDAVDMYAPPHHNLPTIRLMCKFNIHSVRGNHDYYVKTHFLNIFEAESQQYFMEMPLFLDINFSGLKVRIYHATPKSLDDFIPDNAGEKVFLSLFGEVNADVIVLGHTHKHFLKSFGGVKFVNPGSLGMPDEKSTFCVLDKEGGVEFLFLD